MQPDFPVRFLARNSAYCHEERGVSAQGRILDPEDAVRTRGLQEFFLDSFSYVRWFAVGAVPVEYFRNHFDPDLDFFCRDELELFKEPFAAVQCPQYNGDVVKNVVARDKNVQAFENERGNAPREGVIVDNDR